MMDSKEINKIRRIANFMFANVPMFGFTPDDMVQDMLIKLHRYNRLDAPDNPYDKLLWQCYLDAIRASCSIDIRMSDVCDHIDSEDMLFVNDSFNSLDGTEGYPSPDDVAVAYGSLESERRREVNKVIDHLHYDRDLFRCWLVATLLKIQQVAPDMARNIDKVLDKKPARYNREPISAIAPDGMVCEFSSVHQASQVSGVVRSAIYKCIQGLPCREQTLKGWSFSKNKKSAIGE